VPDVFDAGRAGSRSVRRVCGFTGFGLGLVEAAVKTAIVSLGVALLVLGAFVAGVIVGRL
jgi:hypothetical protein